MSGFMITKNEEENDGGSVSSKESIPSRNQRQLNFKNKLLSSAEGWSRVAG